MLPGGVGFVPAPIALGSGFLFGVAFIWGRLEDWRLVATLLCVLAESPPAEPVGMPRGQAISRDSFSGLGGQSGLAGSGGLVRQDLLGRTG